MRRFAAPSIFILVFFACFALQFRYTQEQTLLDQGIWQPAVVALSQGHLPGPDDSAYGYPGTSFLLPAGALVHFGVDPWIALKSVLVTLFSLFVAGAAVVMYLLRKGSLWWLAGALMLLLQPVFLRATPPSALASALVPLLCLLALYMTAATGTEHSFRASAYRSGHEKNVPSRLPALVLGLVAGIALATRLDISAAVCAAIAVLLFIERDKRLWIVAGSALAVFVLLDPYMWNPVHYALDMYAKIHLHFFDKSDHPSLVALAEQFGLAVVSFVLAFLLAALAPRALPFSQRFLLWLAATTLAIGGILLLSHYHPVWYFYPLFLVWEVFGPLFIAAPFDARFLPAHSFFGKPAVRTCALFALPILQLWLAHISMGFL